MMSPYVLAALHIPRRPNPNGGVMCRENRDFAHGTVKLAAADNCLSLDN